MKSSSLAMVVLTLFGFASPGFADHAVRVEAKLSTSHEDPKGSSAEVVKKQMTVTLSGSARSGGDQLRVIARFYADELETGQKVLQKQLEATTTLQSGRVELVLPAVTFEFTPAHAKSTGAGRRARSVKVPASGRRYHGWQLKVMKGDAEVGSAMSHPALKDT